MMGISVFGLFCSLTGGSLMEELEKEYERPMREAREISTKRRLRGRQNSESGEVA